MANVQYGVHSYPNADGTKPFQTRGRIWGRTVKIIEITEITAIFTCCPRSQFPSAPMSGLELPRQWCPQHSRVMALRGSGIYCIVDTFTEVDNLVSELKSRIIVLHPMFLIRKNVTF